MSDEARASWVREQLEHVAMRVRADLRELFGELKKKKRDLLLPDGDLKVVERLVREVALQASGNERPALEDSLAALAKRFDMPSAFGSRFDEFLRAAGDRTLRLTPLLHYRLGFFRPGQGSRRPARFTVDLCRADGTSLFEDLATLDEMSGAAINGGDNARETSRRVIPDDFLAQVEAIARIRVTGAIVERVRNARGDGEHLRVTESHTGIARQYPVAVAAVITQETFDRFLDDVDAFYRANDTGLISIFVYGGPPASEALRDAAGLRRVALKSFIEYQGLIDFREYLAWQSRRLSSDRRYLATTYIAQRMRCSGASDEEVGNAAATLLSWLRAPSGQFILILGDFGNGKTFLLREITRALTNDPGVVPVLIELRDLEKAHTVDQLIAQHFARTPLRQISLDAFRYMLQHGRIVLLFDGFDELVLRSSYARAADHFETVLQAVGGDAKIVVTSRTQFFRSDAEVHAVMRKTAIGQRVEQVFGRRLCDLLSFNPLQIFAYLSKRFQSDEAATRFFERLGEPLAELASNPRMLSFLTDIPSEELLAALQADPPRLTDIYRVLLDLWLTAEHERVRPRGAIETLQLGERWDAVRALALRIWRSGDSWIGESDLGAIVAELVEAPAARALEPEETAFQVGSGTLLVRDEAGRFSFIHPSVMEWLVAYDASQSIAAQRPSPVLAMRELSSLMVLFLVQMIGHDQAVAWASEALANATPNEIAKTNALLILQALGTSRAAGANLVRQNLSGHDLSGQSLIDADLTAATLDRAALVGTDLSGARLLRTSAAVADFTDAVLEGADVRNATFTGSRMYGADLRVEHADAASFRRCKLVGSKNDEKLLAADTVGAVFDLPDSLEAMVSTDCNLRAFAFACDGELLVGVGECVVRIWDLVVGVEVRRLRGHDDWVRDLSVHPNGRLCATCGDDMVVRIWDLGTGVEIGVLVGADSYLFCVAFHPGGKLVAAGGKDGMIHVWEVDGGALLHAIHAHENAVQSISFSSDGAYLASGSKDRTVAFWDFRSMQLIRRTTPFPTKVFSVVMRPGTTTAAFGTEAGEIWCWRALEGEPVLLGAHEQSVTSLAFDAEGQRLASASKDETARVWDTNAADGANVEMRRLKHDRGVIAVAFSPKSGELATAADGGTIPVHFWDLPRAYEVRTFRDADGFDPDFAVTRDGMMAMTGVDDKTTTLWDLRSAREILRFQETGLTLTATFSRDGRFVLTGGLAPPTLHHLAPGGEGRTMYEFDRTLWTLALSPDGTQVACPRQHDIEIRGVDRGELIARLKGHTATIWHLAFSPDGSRLVSGSSDHTTWLWNLREQSGVVLPSSVDSPVRRVAFSPDGLLIGAVGHVLMLWNTATGTLHESPLNGTIARSLAFSDDGTRVAVGDSGGRIRVYDLATGEEMQRLQRHDGTVKQLAFFGRDRMILSSSEDYTVRLWDLPKESLMAVFASFPEGWVAYDARGRYKLGGSPSGRLWHTVNCCRFEAGELLPYRPDLQVADDAPLYEFPPRTFDK